MITALFVVAFCGWYAALVAGIVVAWTGLLTHVLWGWLDRPWWRTVTTGGGLDVIEFTRNGFWLAGLVVALMTAAGVWMLQRTTHRMAGVIR